MNAPEMTRAEIEEAARRAYSAGDAITQLLAQLDAAKADSTLNRVGDLAYALQVKTDALDAANARADAAEAQVVWANYNEEYPTYYQGNAGRNEINDLVTAEVCANLVKMLLTEKARADAAAERMRERCAALEDIKAEAHDLMDLRSIGGEAYRYSASDARKRAATIRALPLHEDLNTTPPS